MIVREAKIEDALAIAAIHVRAWQAAYQGIVPSAWLDSLSIEQRERHWRHSLEQTTSSTWVAEDGNQILGWIHAAASRDADAELTTSEVWAIYVDPAHWREGVGRRLWREAAEYLAGAGFSEVTLWVLKENAQAIAFYETIGLTVDGSEKSISLGGTELIEIRMRRRLGG